MVQDVDKQRTGLTIYLKVTNGLLNVYSEAIGSLDPTLIVNMS